MTRDLYKIVFINHFAGIPKINERTLRHFIIAKGLNPKKYESLIICSQKHYQSIKSNNYPNNKIINIDGVNFLFVDEVSIKNNNLLTKVIKMASFSMNLFYLTITNRIPVKNIDLVYSSSPDLFTCLAGYFFAKKNKAKYFFEIRDIWPLSQIVLHGFSKNHPMVMILSFIERFLYKKSDYLISPLKNFDIYLKSLSISNPYKFIPQSFYGYNDSSLKIEVSEKLKSYKKIGIYAGSVGSFYKIENLLTFFPKNLKNHIAIIIIGDGDRFNQIKLLKEQLKLDNFFIFNSVDHQKLSSYYKIADFAICTIPFHDQLYQYGLCPLKIYDYMYHKMPILYIGEPNYLDICHKNFFVCEFENKTSYYKSLLKIYNMSKEDLILNGIKNFEIVNETNSPKILIENFESIL